MSDLKARWRLARSTDRTANCQTVEVATVNGLATVVVSGLQGCSIPEPEIVRLVAWKEDLGTIDRIWLRFEWGAETYSISEDMPGFWEMIPALVEAQDGFDLEAWNEIPYPAFATNETVVYERSGSRPPSLG